MEGSQNYFLDLSDGSEKGLGQWYLNIELLRDPNFVREINEKWVGFSQLKTNFSSVSKWWDRAKEMVKNIAITFSIHKKQVQSELDIFLQKESSRLEGLLDQDHSDQIVKELDCILKRQKELLLKKSEGSRVRARLPNFEENEQNISYYSRMEKLSLRVIVFIQYMIRMVCYTQILRRS